MAASFASSGFFAAGASRGRSGSSRTTNSSTSIVAIAGFAASAPCMYVSLKVTPAWRKYLQYARRITVSRHPSPARSTSRLKPSLSTSPDQMRANASRNFSSMRSGSKSGPSAWSIPKSWIHTRAAPARLILLGCSSSTVRPMFSSIGSASGEHHGTASGLEELEAQPPLLRLQRAVEAHLDAVLSDALHLLHVEHRHPGGVALAVVGAERVAVALEEPRAVLLAEGLQQGVVQVVGPGAAHRLQAALQVPDVVARRALRVDVTTK